MPINVQDFILPEIPIKESAGLKTMADQMRYNQEVEYRRQKEADSDEWKKIALIQDLTDLSKHQTGNDVANYLGNQKASEIIKQYTAQAKTMSPSDLMANISKDMSGIVSGMDAMRDELTQREEQLKQLKQAYPNIDISRLAADDRAEVLNRRIANGSFVNPLQVGASTIDFGNPDFLRKYVTGNKNLFEAVSNPKGVDPTDVFVGKPEAYTKFSAKIPIWRKPNYTEQELQNGFLRGKNPSLGLKFSTLPAQSLPSSNGKPFNVIDKDVYDTFMQNGTLALEVKSGAANMFPGYDNFTPQEKEYAERKFLHDFISTNDQNNFHPTAVKAEPRTNIKVNVGGSGSSGNNINGNEFDRIPIPEKNENLFGSALGSKTRKNLQPEEMPQRVFAILKTAGMDISDAVYFDTEVDKDGKIQSITPYFDYGKDNAPNIKKGSKITRQDMYDAQLKYNAEPQKGKQPTFGMAAETGSTNTNARKYKIGGKEFSQEQVQKAASKYKMTVAQYLQSVGGQ